MFEKITPEQAGIPSATVKKFIEKLEKRGAASHGFLMMKDGKIFAETYWSPFHKDFCHRMYSQTKSFVGVAIGLLEEEGKLSLDDNIIEYFPEKIQMLQEYHKHQTIKDMLMMCTAGGPSNWFLSKIYDRTEQYFNEKRDLHPSGTIWEYDSPGSQVLCSLVEKLSGKTLLDYLKEKLFNKMNAFQTATILKTPTSDSWGDSAMLCTLRDMASFGQFVMNYGVWNGERLMNEEYLRTATSKLVDNRLDAHYCAYHQGYGYQIWRVSGNGFAFVGMGDQLTVCYPDKNLLFSYVSDNQGTNLIRQMIFTTLEEEFVDQIQTEPLPENQSEYQSLQELIKNLKLRAVNGEIDSPFRKELNGTTYVCNDNPMGIKKLSFRFKNATEGEFRYTNAQGDKILPFGVNHNVFGKFPQLGYANEYGNVPTKDGFMYDDAVSLAWTGEKSLILFVQIIDRYFGNMSATFSFKDDEVYATFNKTAEFFLNEYNGHLIAKKVK